MKIFFSAMALSVFLPTCSTQTTCRLPNRPAASFVSNLDVPKGHGETIDPSTDGQVWTMRCNLNAEQPELRGNSVSTCTDGSWEPLFGRCFAQIVGNPIDCGPPKDPTNGYLDMPNNDASTLAGARRDVLCNNGYQLLGPDFIMCGSDGQWSKTAECIEPPTTTTTSTTTSTTTTTTRTRKTTTTTPQPVLCEDPEPPENGRFVDDYYFFGNEVGSQRQVACNSQFRLQDPAQNLITCQASGDWDNLVVCVPRLRLRTTTPLFDCGPLPALLPGTVYSIVNGVFSTTLGSRRKLECLPGFRRDLTVDVVVVCEAKWVLYEMEDGQLYALNGKAECYRLPQVAAPTPVVPTVPATPSPNPPTPLPPVSTTQNVNRVAEGFLVFFFVMLILALAFIVVYGTIVGWYNALICC